MAQLLDEARTLGSSLTPSEVPPAGEVQQVLGALIKVLEHAGVAVADDLLPEAKPVTDAVEAVAAPEVAAATSALESLVHRAEAALGKLEGHSAPASSSVPPAPSDS